MQHKRMLRALAVVSLLIAAAAIAPAPVYAKKVIDIRAGEANDPRCQPTNPQECYTALQAAIEAINNDPAPDNPDDPSMMYVYGNLNNALWGDGGTYDGPIVITRSVHIIAMEPNLKISGGGGRPITIDGRNATRAINVRISGFTISFGDATEAETLPRIGGGILVYEASPLIENNTIRNNVASADAGDGFGGGIGVFGGAPVLRNNQVFDNIAAFTSGRRGHGGGISLSVSDAVLENNLVWDNRGGGFQLGIGGGVYINTDGPNGGPTLLNNRILANSAAALASNVGTAGGVYSFAATPIFTNTVIAQNQDSEGAGGILLDGGQGSFTHTTVANNTSTKTSTVRAGVFARFGAQVTMVNSIIANHAVGVYAESTAALPTSLVTLDHSLFYQNGQDTRTGTNATMTNNNAFTGTDTSPQFVNPNASPPDYRIGAESKARDRGTSTVVTTDIANRPRLVAPDLGAYEFLLNTFTPMVVR